MISTSFRSALSWINQAENKEAIKHTRELLYKDLGYIVIISELVRVKNYFSPPPIPPHPLNQNNPVPLSFSRRVVVISSKLALISGIFSAKKSLISWICTKILSDEQWQKIFGPNINFAGNPWHPRHVISIVGFVLGIPAVIYAIWNRFKEDDQLENQKEYYLFTSFNIQYFLNNHYSIVYLAAICTILSRPSLHLCNQFAQKILR